MLSGVARYHVERFGERQWTPIRAFRGKRIENVDNGEDPGYQRDFLCPQALRVALSIEVFMVLCDRQCRSIQPGIVGNDFKSQR